MPGSNKSDAPLAQPSPARTAAYYRNLYKERLDFRALAAEDGEFAHFARHGIINFRDPAAVMQLTKTLLRRDFGLQMELPSDRLCPPVPNRHAYVQWIGALLETTGRDRDVVGADVGTGASCIYPLLACAQHDDWQFVATDIDAKSLGCARDNVARNKLQDRIKVVTRTRDDTLVPLAQAEDSRSSTHGLPQRLSFVMMNPPFYASAAEMEASASAKEQPPHTACTGAPVEMVYEGPEGGDEGGMEGGSDARGEVAFVGRMMTESAQLRGRVGWYTAMVGKLSSLVALVERLRHPDVGIDNYAVAAFVTGSKTRRWALGWSYGARRPTVDVARGFSGAGSTSTLATGFESCRHILPPITEVDVWSTPDGGGDSSRSSVSGIGKTVDAALRGLELLSWEWDARTLQGAGRARENVWGRAWRRKKMREAAAAGGGTSAKDIPSTSGATATPAADTECAFGFEVKVRAGVAETTVGCRWLEGHSEVIYQSFCGFLKTKLKEAIAQQSVEA